MIEIILFVIGLITTKWLFQKLDKVSKYKSTSPTAIDQAFLLIALVFGLMMSTGLIVLSGVMIIKLFMV